MMKQHPAYSFSHFNSKESFFPPSSLLVKKEQKKSAKRPSTDAVTDKDQKPKKGKISKDGDNQVSILF